MTTTPSLSVGQCRELGGEAVDRAAVADRCRPSNVESAKPSPNAVGLPRLAELGHDIERSVSGRTIGPVGPAAVGEQDAQEAAQVVDRRDRLPAGPVPSGNVGVAIVWPS